MSYLKISDTTIETFRFIHYEQSNFLNRLHGGDMLFFLVEAGMLSATKVAMGTTVLASLDDVIFKKPVKLGDIVKVRAETVYVGNTSLEVEVSAFDRDEEVVSAYATYVKVDDLLRPAPVNVKIIAESEDDKRKMDEAKRRRENRLSKILNRQKMRFYVDDITDGLRYRISNVVHVSPELTYDGRIMSAGKLLKLMDDLGGIICLNYINYNSKNIYDNVFNAVVTVAVKGLAFYSPIRLNDIVTIRAGLIYVGNTSADILINVIREDVNGTKEHVATAYFTYVRVDKEGKPIKMPEYVPVTEREKRLHEEALTRRGLRK
ncbi:thioesterase superfamily protein [Sulfolobus islandicus Y.G.57.14]|jgi:acyl-CoA hydrolase|uniref:Acyl-CoA hydrolase n=7 Tax=Saccharolobus islandicus TaxID=43080 RepID=M9U664_SACIS|nr:hotdog domain-containing protein [Sulfolobus islandicus]ACP34252.1 thioesterase superfamily protein [Sulfolobus islandicus L.S.2.15]ACP36990.1 thioesterase superfamily protein [Sulfolobus islandicus M.14.25]ACP44394.1 thioesterase superfamily protein [Sulfolobus islandicus Y.G.57.14]ACP54127.1 thioesterase superfamily protein [Sulfolobus islandicus M.16.27]ADB85900.1 thioesterase superfamily protein [Sulfolobus islandicus L.D.8.5]